VKRRTTTLITLSLVALLLGACVPLSTSSAPSPETQPTSTPGTPQGQAVTPSGQASPMVGEPSAATAPPSATVAPSVTVAPAATVAPSATVAPAATAAVTPTQAWEVATLLVAPGESGRLYALVKDSSGGIYASPTPGVRLMISDDYAATWTPFPGGLPVPPECMVNVNLDYFTPDALYASTCQGLYTWEGTAWAKRSDQLTDVVAVVYGQPDQVWAAAHWPQAQTADVIRSDDGGRTWRNASAGLTTFGGLANLGIDPHDANILYGIIRPKYAGSYLRRGTSEGNWETMPTPQDDATIDTGMTIDGNGALYVTMQLPPCGLWVSRNPSTADRDDVRWELIQEFDSTDRVVLLASGWGPQGLAFYANIWPSSNGMGQLHRSLDGGHTWEELPMP